MENTLKEKIRKFVESELAENGDPTGVSEDASLIDADILDSLAILKLLNFLEEEFGIFPEEEELYPQNFETINMIYDYIKNKRQE